LLDPLLKSSSLDPLESSLLDLLLESSSLDPFWSLLCSTLYWNLLSESVNQSVLCLSLVWPYPSLLLSRYMRNLSLASFMVLPFANIRRAFLTLFTRRWPFFLFSLCQIIPRTIWLRGLFWECNIFFAGVEPNDLLRSAR
jgi:hypothetical protein